VDRRVPLLLADGLDDAVEDDEFEPAVPVVGDVGVLDQLRELGRVPERQTSPADGEDVELEVRADDAVRGKKLGAATSACGWLKRFFARRLNLRSEIGACGWRRSPG
jgi:hypothetical protein